jgi:hypothetical protein
VVLIVTALVTSCTQPKDLSSVVSTRCDSTSGHNYFAGTPFSDAGEGRREEYFGKKLEVLGEPPLSCGPAPFAVYRLFESGFFGSNLAIRIYKDDNGTWLSAVKSQGESSDIIVSRAPIRSLSDEHWNKFVSVIDALQVWTRPVDPPPPVTGRLVELDAPTRLLEARVADRYRVVVLDLVNESREIRAAFQQLYELAELTP